MQAASALSANVIAAPGGESAAAPDASGGGDAFASALAALMGVLGPVQPVTSDPTAPAASGGGASGAGGSAGAFPASPSPPGASAASASAAALPLGSAATGVIADALQALEALVSDLQPGAPAAAAPSSQDASANAADASATTPEGAGQNAPSSDGPADPLLALLAELSNSTEGAATPNDDAATGDQSAGSQTASGGAGASPQNSSLDPQLIRFIARGAAAAQGEQAAASTAEDASAVAAPGALPVTDPTTGGAQNGQPAGGAVDAQAPSSPAANPIAAGLVMFNLSGVQPAAPPQPLATTRLAAAKPTAGSASAAISDVKAPGSTDIKASTLALFDAGHDDANADAPPIGDDPGAASGDGQSSDDASAGAPPPAFQLAATAGAAAQAIAIPPAAAALAQAHGADITAQVAAQIASRAGAVRSSFDFSLEPHGLGRVDVSLKIDAQGSLSAVLSFDNPAVAAEARNRAGDLHQALQQAGFDLSQAGLSFTAGGGHGQGAAFQGAGQPSYAAAGPNIADRAAPELPAIAATFAGRSAAGGLDITI